MPFRLTRRAGFWRRTHALRRIVLVMLAVGVALFLRMASQGFPDRWVGSLSEALSSSIDGTVRLEDVTFGLRRGLQVGIVRIHLDEAGPPLLHLAHARVKPRWHWGFPSPLWIREIEVQHIVLSALPRMQAGGRTARLPDFGPLVVRCESADILGTSFREVVAEVALRDARLEVERLHCDLSPLRHPSEIMTAEFSFGLEDRSVRGAAHGELDPLRLAPLLQSCRLDDAVAILRRFEFPAGPAGIRLRLDYAPAESRRRAELTLSAGASLYRGVPLISARVALTAEGGGTWDVVRLDQLALERPEGMVRGALRFDLPAHGLEFTASSTFDPRHFFGLLGLFTHAAWADWKFGSPTELVASGYYGFLLSERATMIEGKVRAPSLQYRRQRARGCEAEFVVTSERCEIIRSAAQAYGGAIEARGDILWPEQGPVRFAVVADLRDAQLGAFMNSWSTRTMEEPGSLDLMLDLQGEFGDQALRTLEGSGTVRVRDARIYRMPLFAGFTDFMVRNVPGVDFVLSQNDLNAEFKVGGYRMIFDLLQVEGSIFSITGSGNYWFTDHLDIGVRVNLLKQRTWLGRVLKVALFPVSKLFEFELAGSLMTPRWSPTTLSLRGRRDATPEQRGLQAAPGSDGGGP